MDWQDGRDRTLGELRDLIDGCDGAIVSMLVLRSRLVYEVARRKISLGETTSLGRRRDREIAVMNRAIKSNEEAKGHYARRTIQEVFEAVFSGSELIFKAALRGTDDEGDRGT